MNRQFEERPRAKEDVDRRDMTVDELFEELQCLDNPLWYTTSREVAEFSAFLSGIFMGQTPEVGASNGHECFVFGDWLVSRYDYPSGYSWFRSVRRLAAESGTDEWSVFCKLWQEFRKLRNNGGSDA